MFKDAINRGGGGIGAEKSLEQVSGNGILHSLAADLHNVLSILGPFMKRGKLRARCEIIQRIDRYERRSGQAFVKDEAKAPKIVPSVSLNELIWKATGRKRKTSGRILVEALDNVDLCATSSWPDYFPQFAVTAESIKKMAKRGSCCALLWEVPLHYVGKLRNVELIDNQLCKSIIMHRFPILLIFHVALKVKRRNHRWRDTSRRH